MYAVYLKYCAENWPDHFNFLKYFSVAKKEIKKKSIWIPMNKYLTSSHSVYNYIQEAFIMMITVIIFIQHLLYCFTLQGTRSQMLMENFFQCSKVGRVATIFTLQFKFFPFIRVQTSPVLKQIPSLTPTVFLATFLYFSSFSFPKYLISVFISVNIS